MFINILKKTSFSLLAEYPYSKNIMLKIILKMISNDTWSRRTFMFINIYTYLLYLMKKSHKIYKNDFTGFRGRPRFLLGGVDGGGVMSTDSVLFLFLTKSLIISGEDCDSLTTTIFLCRRCLLTPTRYLGDNSGTGPSLEAVSVA